METKTPAVVLTLTEIKESLGAEKLRFVPSAAAVKHPDIGWVFTFGTGVEI